MAKEQDVTVMDTESVATDEWVVVVHFAKLGERRAFVKALTEAGEKSDEAPLFPWMAKFIRKWPYKANPADVSCYDELEIEQWDAALGKVLKALETFRSSAIQQS